MRILSLEEMQLVSGGKGAAKKAKGHGGASSGKASSGCNAGSSSSGKCCGTGGRSSSSKRAGCPPKGCGG